MDLVSIVIPVYNVEKYLRQCLESIVCQTYKNLQIILVDDGSTDASNKICDEYALKDSRIQVIHKSNGGLSDARNRGIDKAVGKYITFVDSDDFIKLDMVEYLLRLLTKHHSDISVCQPQYVSEDGLLLKRRAAEIKGHVVAGAPNCIHDFLSNEGIGTVAWGKMYKMAMFQNIRYPEGRYHEDVFTTYKLVAEANSIAVGEEAKYMYRIRPSSIMQSSFSPKHLDAVIGKEEMAIFIKENFPESAIYAYASIIYAANQCVLRMGESSEAEKQYIDYLQNIYGKYERYYLRCAVGKLKSKVFSILAYINVQFTIRCMSLIYKVKSYV